jgi:hypothetical protein
MLGISRLHSKYVQYAFKSETVDIKELTFWNRACSVYGTSVMFQKSGPNIQESNCVNDPLQIMAHEYISDLPIRVMFHPRESHSPLLHVRRLQITMKIIPPGFPNLRPADMFCATDKHFLILYHLLGKYFRRNMYVTLSKW